MAGQKKPSPLWKYMPARAYVPQTGPKPTDTGFKRPKRNVVDADIEPLRVNHEWSMGHILDKLPPAEHPSESLSLLLVAAAVTQGPGKIYDLADNAHGFLRPLVSRVDALVDDAGLARHRAFLSELAERSRLALEELPEIRTRAANEMDVDVSRPYGLRLLDLTVLSLHLRTVVNAHEATRRPNPAGVHFARCLTAAAPDPEFGDVWLERLFRVTGLRGVQFFWPKEYDRLLLVFDDGRLAYDPGAAEAGDKP